MNFQNLTPGWFDVLALITLGIGGFMGRKRGMSNELLDVMQWLMMVVLGAMLYDPLATLLMKVVPISPMWARIDAYAVICIGIKIGMTVLKRAVGEKLVGSDLFGRMEYHLGTLAGVLRVACMIIVTLALLNARAFSVEQVEADLKAQVKEYGSAFFPTFGQIQRDIFYRSIVGDLAKTHLDDHLVKATLYQAKVERAGITKDREKALDDVINPKAKKKN